MKLDNLLNKNVTEIKTRSPREFSEHNNLFTTDSDRREKVDHQRTLFKMAVISTSTAPSPTRTSIDVNQTDHWILIGLRIDQSYQNLLVTAS